VRCGVSLSVFIVSERRMWVEMRAYVDNGIFQHRSTNAIMVDRGLCRWHCAFFEVPAAALLVVGETRGVVAFVEILEYRREGFGFLGGQVDAFA